VLLGLWAGGFAAVADAGAEAATAGGPDEQLGCSGPHCGTAPTSIPSHADNARTAPSAIKHLPDFVKGACRRTKSRGANIGFPPMVS
jgi:hypothetical protein